VEVVNYNSTVKTFVNGAMIAGEWIQLYYDKGFAATSFSLTGIAASNTKCPKDFILVGSLSNNKDWNLLSSQVGITSYSGTDVKKTFTLANFTSYNYYRLVVSKTNGSTDLSIAELSFNGFTNTTYTNIDTFSRILYNTTENDFLQFHMIIIQVH